MTNEDQRMKRIFPTKPVIANKRGKNLRDLLVKAKVCSRRKSSRKIDGYSRCGRGFFNQCATCSLIPEKGIKTHKCDKTQKTYQINDPVTCTTENVIHTLVLD